MNSKRWATWMGAGLLGLFVLPGCQRDDNPLLGTPTVPATLLDGFAWVESWESPNAVIGLYVNADGSDVTNLELANIAILVNAKPEVPLSIDKIEATSGRYYISFRTRERIDESLRVLVYYGGQTIEFNSD